MYMSTLQAHTDWIFDIQWITEDLVITGMCMCCNAIN